MNRTITTFILLLSILSLTTPVSAQSNGNEQMGNRIFSELEQRAIKEYFQPQRATDKKSSTNKKRGKSKGKSKEKKSKGLPPGLAKRDKLPPGLAKQLERNGHLPPGLEKRDLPDDLEERLPPRSDDYKRVVVDSDVLLIEEATGLILDILKDVF
ncbi:MAG: hypothetical protein ABW168_01745 [Sedimenticola sp.]